MALLQDYTAMPWALESALLPQTITITESAETQHSDSDESTGSLASSVVICHTTTTTNPKHEALLKQLAASHTAQHQLEERLEDQKRESEAHLEQQKRESHRRIAKLEQDLAQFQKREEAIKAVFLREFEKERVLMLEDRRLKIKADALARKAKKLNDKAEQLERKRVNTGKELRKLEKTQLELEESIALLRGGDNISSKPATKHNHALDDEDDMLMHAPGNSYPFSYGNVSLMNLEEFRTGISTISTSDKGLTLLRRHDYDRASHMEDRRRCGADRIDEDEGHQEGAFDSVE
jgi:hypothetical protein